MDATIRKKPEQIKIRLSIEEAQKIRAVVALARRPDGRMPTMAEYIMSLVDGVPYSPPPVLDLREFAQVPHALHALYAGRDAIQSATAQLRQVAGALRHAFVEFSTPAELAIKPILVALEEVRSATSRLEKTINETEIRCAPARDELAKISRLCGERLEKKI